MSIQFLHHTDSWFWIIFTLSILTLGWIFLSIKNVRQLKGILAIRVFILFILIFILLQPKITWKKEHSFPLHWNVYTDQSVSMGYHRTISSLSYINGINRFIEQIKNNDDESKFYLFDYHVEEKLTDDFKLDGEATDLSAVLDHLSDTKNQLAGAIIISDGRITKGSGDQQEFSSLSIPVYTIGVGDSLPMVDISIQSITAPTVVVKGEDMDVNVTIFSNGQINDRVNILLYDGNKLIGSKYIQLFGDGELSDIRFRVIPQELGDKKYLVKASVLKEEININNNQLPFKTTVLKNRYKVAIITGAANFNTGPIKKIIKGFPRVEVDHFIQIGKKFAPNLQVFWETGYELIVFDNFPISPVSNRWKRVFAKKIVTQNSSLLWIAGPNISVASAESMYPFFHVNKLESAQKAQGEELHWYWGQAHPNTSLVNALYPDYLYSNNNTLPPLKPKLILEPQESMVSIAYFDPPHSVPLMVAGEVEGLRSIIWTSADMYSLYYKLTDTDFDNVTKEILHRGMGWLMRTGGDRDIYFRLDKDLYQQGEEIRISGTYVFSEEEDILSSLAYIDIKTGDRLIKTYELNFNPEKKLWVGSFIAGKPGDYDYEIILSQGDKTFNQTGNFIVDESQIELNQVSVNTFGLQSISMATGAEYFPWSSRADIYPYVLAKKQKETIIKTAQLNENIYLTILLISLLAIDWSIRRFMGLS